MHACERMPLHAAPRLGHGPSSRQCFQPPLTPTLASPAIRSGAAPGADTAAALAAQSLLLVEQGQLDGALAACTPVLRGGSAPAAAASLRRQLQAALQHSDDCVRKPVLAAWLLRAGG